MKAPVRAALLFALLTGAAAALATERQDPQQPPPIFRAGVKLVRVDVSVTGRDQAAVAGLEPSDFEIQEDGIPQKVEALQFVRLDGTRTSDGDESLEIRSSEHAALEAARDDVRLFAIFLDDYHVTKSPIVTQSVRRALRALVEQFGPNDLIVVMDPLTPLSALRFTRSRDELLARIEKFEGRRGELFPVKSVMEEAQLTQRNVWELRGGVSLSALGAIVTHLGGLREGRKSVLFVSQGPPLGPMGSANEDRLKEVVEAANRGNVTIHVLDPRPLGSGSRAGGPDVLHRMYQDTGGRAIVNSNDPATRIREVIADASAYYLLGYSPSRELADGKFHRIEVRVKRRGVRVLARRGYWAPTDAEANPVVRTVELEPGLTEALSELTEPKDGRAADVWVGASMGPEAFTRLTITWEPTSRGGGKRPARLTVERLRDDHDEAPPETRVIGVRGGAEATSGILDVDAGTEVTLRFTVEADEGTVIDQWDDLVRVPALSGRRLALSTPRFLRARSAFEAQAIAAGQDPPPAASRRFHVRDRVFVEVDCYGAGAPAISARVLNARGDRLIDLVVPPVVNGKTRFTLPLASLAPSTYILRLEAQAGQQDVQQRTAFRVVP